MEFCATCPKGFEKLLAEELASLKIPQVRALRGQVSFGGELADAYRACLWSRLASRVLLVLARVDAHTADSLYEGLCRIDWTSHLAPGATFAIDAHGTNANLRNTQFVALRSKDAISDVIFHARGARPMTDTNRPDVTVAVRVSGERATACIDLSGEPLFHRGYDSRAAKDVAPLRPDYAAALLAAGGWFREVRHGDPVLAALWAGQGSVLAEAAGAALDRAPGISCEVSFVGVPEAADAVRTAKGGRLVTCDLSWLDDDSLAVEASVLSEASAVAGLSVAALAKSDSLDAALRAEPAARVDVYVGRDDGELAFYEATDELAAPAEVTLAGNVRVPVLVPASDQFARRLAKVAKLRAKWARREDVSCYRVYDADLPDYSVAIELYQGLEGRGRWLQISEYAAPKDVDRQLARRRLMDVLAIAPRVLDVDPRCVNLRVRTRARGGSQYAGHGSAPTTPERHEDAYARLRGQRADLRNRHKPSLTDLPEGAHLVDEGGLTFEVNFSTRLDCGIFLDHRETRSRIREMMKQTLGSKRFLNLFAYTGTATCYAADGGAKHTTTVDLSRPSLDWARRNMARNGFRGPEHEFVQADVLSYINEQRHSPNRWDLVFCDVPTFSNSQRMRKSSFDVQRDHVELIIGVSRLLTRNGSAIFSCNLRGFKPDVEALKKAGVVLEDITEETIPEDFQRNKKIHHCYIVKRG